MRRIRVVFSIGAMHGGGSERQMLLLLRHLDRQRFEPFLYLVYKSGPLLEQVPVDVSVTSFDTRVTPSRLYLPGLMHSRRVRDFARFLQEVKADVSYDSGEAIVEYDPAKTSPEKIVAVVETMGYKAAIKKQ